MDTFGGALNRAAYQSNLSNNQLPCPDHITYAGVFNEIYFNVGEKPKDLIELHFGYASTQIPVKQYAKEIEISKNEHFLGIFTKSIKDGQPRDQTPLHAVIVLDISGSMDGSITKDPKQDQSSSRLQLAKTAISLLLDKMRPNDALALVIFDDQAETLYPLTLVSQIDKILFNSHLKSIETRGGTTILCGLSEARKCFDNYPLKENTYVERRMIMLTDVCDNSVGGAQKFIQHLTESKIHSTIIGISSDFQSSTCEALVNVKGFNYFCALEDKDLIKFLVDNFDYTFFPFAFDIEISLQSSDIDSIEVFGSNDAKEFQSYQTLWQKMLSSIIVTKSKQSFPSSNIVDSNNQVKSEGGLILCKLKLKDQRQDVSGTVNIKYKDQTGKEYHGKYDFKQHFDPEKENFSEQSFKEGVYSFYYVKNVRQLLEEIEKSGALNSNQKETYLNRFKQLHGISTKSNEEELNKIITILEKL